MKDVVHEEMNFPEQALPVPDATLPQSGPARPVLHRLLEHTRLHLGADRAFLVLYEPDYGAYDGLVTGEIRLDRSMPRVAELVRPHGRTHQVAASGTHQVVHYASGNESGHRPHPFFDDIRTALGLPLAQEGHVFGVLWLQYRRFREFTEQEISLARLLTHQLAIAYPAIHRGEKVEAMGEVGEMLSRADSSPATLKAVVDRVRRVIQADSMILYIFDAATRRFDYSASVCSGLTSEEWELLQGVDPTPDGTAYRVLQQGWVEVLDVQGRDDPASAVPLNPRTRSLLTSLGICRFIGVALGNGDEPQGVLYVNFRTHRSLGVADKALIRSLAHQVSLTLARTRLLERLERVYQASREVALLATQDDLVQMLEAVARQVQQVLDADAVTLYPFEEATERLSNRPVMVGVRYPERIRGLSVLQGDSIVNQMLERRDPYLVPDVSQDERFRNRRFTQDEEVRSLAVLPLWVYNQRVGVLFVNYRRPHYFTRSEEEDLTLLGYQAAVAIRAAQMRDRLHERVELLRLLAEAGREISTLMEEQQILDRTLHWTHRIIQTYGPKADLVILGLAENESALTFRAADPPELLPGLQQGIGRIDLRHTRPKGIVGRVLETGRSQLRRDLHEEVDPDYIRVDPAIRSELAVPMYLGSRILGVLDVESREAYAFDQLDQEALELLAAQVAVALENARRHRELQEAKGMVGERTALAWMGLADNLWRHTNAKQARIILENARLLERELNRDDRSRGFGQGISPRERMRRHLQRIQQAALAIENRPTVPPPDPQAAQKVELVSLVRERITQLLEDPGNGCVTFIPPRFASIYTVGQPEWLRRALDILIENAVEATQERVKPDVRVELAVKAAWVDVRVRDNGSGLPPGLRERVGRVVLGHKEKGSGLGIGLVLAQVIVEAYGGQVLVLDTGRHGTTMALRLPLHAG